MIDVYKRQERYSGGDDADRVAWYWENSDCQIHPVGEKAANGFGLHDMSGNVQEWTGSLYEYPYNGTETRCIERGTSDSIAVRGGSWIDGLAAVRSDSRDNNDPAQPFHFIGFRLARSL